MMTHSQSRLQLGALFCVLFLIGLAITVYTSYDGDTPKLPGCDHEYNLKIVLGTTIFLLWKINKETLWKTVLDEMFHPALNLSIRMAYELEQQQEVLNIPLDRCEGPMKVKFEKLKKIKILLESSQMKLDDAIMLFRDF